MSRSHLDPEEREGDPLRAAVGLLRRRAVWGAGVAALVFAFAAAVVLLARPVYRAEARLRLGEPPPSTGVSPTGGLLSFLRMGGDPFSNDLELLSSRTLAEEIVRAEQLSVRLDAPRGWHRDSVFVSLALADTTVKATYEATWDGAGGVRVQRRSPEPAEVGRFAIGEPASFGGLSVVFAERKPGAPESVRIKTLPFGEAVRTERGRLQVERSRREANLVDLAYNHHDPAVAAGAVRAAVREFLRLRTHLFQRESGETMDSLRSVASGTQTELREAEDALEAIQRETGLVAPDAQSEALIERYEIAYAALLETRAEADALTAQLARVADTPGRLEAWSTLVAHPRFLENETLAGLLERLTTLEELRMEALSRRQPESREVRTLEEQIVQLDAALRTLVQEYRIGLDQRMGEARRQVEQLDALLADLPARVVELGRRQRSVRILSEVTVLTEQRLRQEELRLALAFSNVQVVDPPALRYRPVWPRKKLGLAVGMLLAAGTGLVAMALVERADGSVRRAARLRALTNAPVLAAPVARRGAWSLETRELDALRRAAGAGCVVVGCSGAEVAARDVSAALDGAGDAPVRVESFADAAAVAARPVVLVVATATTSEAEVRRVVGLIREAGGAVAGTVAACASTRRLRELWG
jgi:uncharacterized protein involved in exopolysaccharide biosynthesis